MKKAVVVKQNPEAEVPTEVLADSIVEISNAMKKLLAGRLNDRALVLLIQSASATKVSQMDIRSVLDAMGSLERMFIRKKA